jgi:hypothetical protein
MSRLCRQSAPLLAAAFLHAGALAQDADAVHMREAMKDAPMNSFRHVGNHLVCKQDTPAPDYRACLRIGSVRVGDSFRIFRERHPMIWKELALEDGVSASIHPAAAADGKTYWVIGRRDDRIVSVQLTGHHASPELAFATLQLGDSEERALALLGPRASIRAVPEIGALLWDYAPFPISVEFIDGKVYSIKIADPPSAP